MQSHVVELRTCNALLLLNYGVLLSTVHESTASICWCRAVGAVVADFEQNREYIDNSYPKMHQNLVRLNWLNSASSSCAVLVGLLVVFAVTVVPRRYVVFGLWVVLSRFGRRVPRICAVL